MRKSITVISLMGVLLFAALAQSAVYRWVDEKGNVHYGDRPQSRHAEELDVPDSTSAAPERNQQQLNEERREKRRKLLDLYQDEREERQLEREKKTAQKARREVNCAAARDKLKRFETYGYLYEPLADGGRRILSHAERREATEEVRAEVRRSCE